MAVDLKNGILWKSFIIYHCQLSTPLLDFITFFEFQMHFPSLSNPYCLLFNMTWSPWVHPFHDGRPLRPQWRTVGAMQIATRASWPWAPFNWDKARTVTWYVSGKVMKVTGFDIFNWNLAMTSDLLKVNQGWNSNQNSVIGVKGVGMSPNILLTAPGASRDITSWMSCWKFATSQPISTYLKSCLL